MMKRLFGLLLLGTVVACGGNGGSNPSTVPVGTYRGTSIPVGLTAFPQDPHDTMATFTASGETSIRIRGTAFSGTVTSLGNEATFVTSGSVITGRLETRPRGNGATWKFYNGEELYVQGDLGPFQAPSLGTEASVPPAGDFVGTSFVLSNGEWVEFGPTELKVDGAGLGYGFINGGGFTQNGLFVGTFAPDATIHEATLYPTGGVISQEPAPPYSYDGTTLTFRIDSLALEPGSCYVVLKRVVATP